MASQYSAALCVLSETDKNRLLCVYFNSSAGAVDWAKATEDFKSSSIDSMKKMVQNAVKKVDKAIADGFEPPSPATEGTPAKAGKSGNKRKKADTEGEGVEEGKVKRGKGRGKKAADEGGEGTSIKAEATESGFY